MPRDLAALIARLELDEKAALLAGADLWSTPGVERVGIPPVRLTDGPNGARGPILPAGLESPGDPSTCMPCGAALGASWDPSVLEAVGRAIAEEARDLDCRVLLGPTVNLHRSPLGGRNFESYAEDPLLAGQLGAAFVRGAQGAGVACTVKHFAGNESEQDRMFADTIADERTLREIHLLPFELAVRDGGALGVMSAYNRLNGEFCSQSRHLLTTVLRYDWEFAGFVVSDWFAFAEGAIAIDAGLDLEMPGPGRAYGPALAEAVRSGVVEEKALDATLGRILSVWDRIGALDATDAAERSDRAEHVAVARRAAIAGTVLLRNDGVLPLRAEGLRRVAVVGPNADRPTIMGGGSASLTTGPVRTPLEVLRDRLGPDVEVVHEAGLDIARSTPAVPGSWLRADGQPGMRVEHFAPGDLGGAVVHTSRVGDGSVMWFGGLPEAGASFSWRATAELTVEREGRWSVSLAQIEPARVRIDGRIVLDGHGVELGPGSGLLGLASEEMTAVLDLSPDHPVVVEIESTVEGPAMLSGARFGIRPALAADSLARAVDAARRADATVVVLGTDAEWESEGADRASLALPPGEDELVRRVLEVAPDAVVVLNVGSPVELPWAEDARALVQTWFGGEEMAPALVDVLLGEVDPGGRLPTTIPRRIQDNPTWGNFPAEGGRIRYGEGVLVGYRWYESRDLDVRFPFGHGLSYTTFEMGTPSLSSPTFDLGAEVRVRVPLTNTGDRAGSEIVQLYVAPEQPSSFRPVKELKAFAKVTLDPGASTVVELTLRDRSFAHWKDPDPALEALVPRLQQSVPWVHPPTDASLGGWVVDPGRYRLHVGRSSVDIAHVCTVEVPEGGPALDLRP